jgi:hypothetical protein
MQNYQKQYLDFFGIDEYDVVEELNLRPVGGKADFHHIDARGMGGRKSKDSPINIQVLFRSDHDRLGDIKKEKATLKALHFKFVVWFMVDRLLGHDYDKAIDILKVLKEKQSIHPYAKYESI